MCNNITVVYNVGHRITDRYKGTEVSVPLSKYSVLAITRTSLSVIEIIIILTNSFLSFK